MRSLAWSIVRAGGRGRAALVVATTAFTSGLLLVAASIVMLWRVHEQQVYQDRLLMPLVDGGTRGGAVLAVVLFTLPVLLLTNQAVRLGSPDQHRRYSALSVAGATRRDLRLWAAIEVGGPALLGAVLGIPVWLVLRQVLGYGLMNHTGALVPMSVGPGFLTPLVLVTVAAYGAVVGWRSAGAATRATERGVTGRRPRPWPLALVLLGILGLVGASRYYYNSDVLALGILSVLLAGVVLSAPWIAQRAGALAARRARSASVLLAARRLEAEPWAAGRAAAAVGVVGLVMGVLGVVTGDLLIARGDYGDLQEYLVPMAIVGVIALVAIGIVAGSVAVHSVESTLERRREMAALVATGVPVATLSKALRAECLLVTLPLTVAFSLLGVAGSVYILGPADGSVFGGLGAVVATVVFVAWTVSEAGDLVRPWLVAAVDPGNLRTE